MKKKAVTLTEIVVATIILASTFAGVFASFLSVRKLIARSEKRLTGTSFVRYFMNNFMTDVNGVNWLAGTGNLASGASASYPTQTVGGTPYNCQFLTSAVGANQYRRVDITVTYPDE
jgi:hypothetical protein